MGTDLSKWHARYQFPVTFDTGPIVWFNATFDGLFIRLGIYDELDEYLGNIQAQRGKFWVSGPLGGYGKSTMLHYIERKLLSNLHKWDALPFHISVGKKTPTVEDNFYRNFINQFLKLPEKLSTAEEILRTKLSTDIQKHVLHWFAKSGKHEIRRIQKELATLDVKELERRFDIVMEEVLSRWANLGIFSKYVLLIDEMDKLDAEDVLKFLSGNQDLFQRLYQQFNFVVFISGHASWVERILDGTEYTYYRGHVFRIPPFQDITDVEKLVETRLIRYLHMVPSDNPWTTEGYNELKEMSGGVPRIIIELSELAINEARNRDLATIGPGILKEIIVTEKSLKPIEDYFHKNPETLLKLRAAVGKRVDRLLYMFYDMPGHRIAKEYDGNLANRTKYLGIELSDADWNKQIRTLVNFDCILDDPFSRNRELAKDICNLFDRLKQHPALIEKIVPTVITKLKRLEPKFPTGKVKPPDFQQIIETSLRSRAEHRWFSKKELFEWFLNSTRIHMYIRACKKVNEREKFAKQVFEGEFKKFIRTIAPNLMIFGEKSKIYYRRLPEGMKASEYTTLKVFQSRDLIDKYIDFAITPAEYDSGNIKKLDRLIEDILMILAELENVELKHNFLRKKIKWKVFRELKLSSDIRRRLDFYARESKEYPTKGMIQGISRQIILDLAREYKDTLERTRLEKAKLKKLLEKEEDEMIEFKSSMCWDYDQNKRNKLVEFALAKAVSCFMNREGGHIIIGVGDNKEILGLENDISVIKKKNVDGFELHFTGIINKYLGKQNRKYCRMSFLNHNGKKISIVMVTKAPHPVFIKSEGKPKFFVRMGNSCQPLDVEEATLYIRDHFQEKSRARAHP